MNARALKKRERARIFAAKYVQNKFNGGEAIKAIYNVTTEESARVMASRVMKQPEFQRAILAVMKKEGLSDDLVAKIHKRNLKQSKNYSASNGAIELYHKVQGNFAPEKHANITATVDLSDPEAVEKRINELISKLRPTQ